MSLECDAKINRVRRLFTKSRVLICLPLFFCGLASPAATAPVIKVQPRNLTLPAGGRVCIPVGAVGTAPLKYQWQRNGVPVAGQTNTFLILPGISANQAGGYSVVVTNSSGSVTSTVAAVSVVAKAGVTAWGDDVFFPISGPKTIALVQGQNQSLAVRTDGTVAAWGTNHYRQCMVPPGLAGVTAVSAGVMHSLALGSDGSLSVWGLITHDPSNYGQGVIPGGLGVTQAIACGPYHNLAVRSNGRVTAWGISNDVPASLSNVTAVAAGCTGYRNLALRSDGTVVAWGDSTNVPAGVASVKSIAVGDSHYLALRNDGTLISWGAGSVTNIPASLNGVQAIAAGGFHSLALRSNGTVSAWGDISTVPAGVSNIVAIASGANRNLAARADGALFSWTAGSNELMGVSDPVGIAVGWSHKLVLKTNGTIVAWGDDFLGELDMPANLTNAVAIAADGYHSVALRANGTVAAWGETATTPPAGLSNVVAIAAGDSHAIALKSDGHVVIWGDDAQTNFAAGLSNVIAIAGGIGSTRALLSDSTVAANDGNMPAGLTNVVAIGFGSVGMVLFSNGTFLNWNIPPTPNPADPPTDLTNLLAMASGLDNELVVRADGTVEGWGQGEYSYGLYPNYGQSTPPNRLKRVLAIAATRWHGMALYSAVPKPVTVATLGFDTQNGFMFSANVEPNESYQIQISGDLINWYDALELNSPTGYFQIGDPDAPAYPSGYYRILTEDFPTFSP